MANLSVNGRIDLRRISKSFLGFCLWIFLPLFFLQSVHWLLSRDFSFQNLISHLGFILGVFLLGWTFENIFSKNLHMEQLGGVLILALSASVYLLSQSTLSAWLLVVSVFSVLMQLESSLSESLPFWNRAALKVFLAGIAGAGVIAALQIEERFSEEEFFAAIQLCVMSIAWLVISLAYQQWSRRIERRIVAGNTNRPFVLLGLVVLCALGAVFTLYAYQNSFFPAAAPAFKGISSESPFICGESTSADSAYRGVEVFEDLIDLVEANPQKAAPEYGLLALVGDDASWAEQFHDSLLSEAGQRLFTLRENSVKYGQCLASQRVYYYWLLSKKNPSLFTSAEKERISDWFAAINRRTLSIGWVDWFYAIAFSKWPSGPYENQECGAGLLAILEVSGLSDPELSAQNREFLAENPRGWLERFRNTDDTYNYQVEWLRNAWYQFLYWRQVDPLNLKNSFEWFLLQSLPDGAPLRYNHFAASSSAQIGYWASNLSPEDFTGLPDQAGILEQGSRESALWLSGSAVDYMIEQEQFLGAVPGQERSTDLVGRAPGWGSCLIFGNSGLPNQMGPLAPDKIVFRDGWQNDSMYMLLNLRFTGWHRYKATNSMVLIYQGGPIASEIHLGEPFSWLPVGRSLLRDKRTPRENMNGLLVQRTGLSSVVRELTGAGNFWAQDPPFYAEVLRFETDNRLDQSLTQISDWRGWRQGRGIHFKHQGPVVITDRVEGPANRRAAISWHFGGELFDQGKGRYRLGEGEEAIEVLLLRYDAPLAPEEIEETWSGESGYTRLVFEPKQHGSFALLTVLLPSGWAGAQASFHETPSGEVLRLSKNGQQAEFDLEGYLGSS